MKRLTACIPSMYAALQRVGSSVDDWVKVEGDLQSPDSWVTAFNAANSYNGTSVLNAKTPVDFTKISRDAYPGNIEYSIAETPEGVFVRKAGVTS